MISSYDYAVNAIGQRTGVATSGTAFPAVPSWLWSYDALGQVTSADSSVATSDRAYQYDAIGNRIEARYGVTTVTGTPNYTANALNQYTTIQQGGTGVSPVYDFDGNVTTYPLPTAPTANSTLVWDAENRLIEVKNSTGTTIEKNVFDSSSRKIATTANGVTTIYLYDGWNCIAEYTRSVGVPPVLKKTRLWGTDLSGSMQGAGGVGGMLSESSQITSNPITFNSSYPTYDGNGNVSEYLDSTGQVTAHFEYDPFGNTVVNTDTSNQFAYRFSTKPLAFATGLYYYGYRYYDPMTGRWPCRDPIEEEGGINLYGFVGNDGVNHWDYLGQSIDRYEIDTNSIPLEVGQVSGTSLAETDVRSWEYSGKTSLTWAAYFSIGLNEKLELKGRLQISIKKRAGLDDNYLKIKNNNSGFTLAQHERYHAFLCKKAFNEAAEIANSFEGIYCGGCSDKAKRYALAIMGLALEKQYLENKAFDNFDYGGGNVSGIDNARYTNAKKELDDAKNEYNISKCVKL